MSGTPESLKGTYATKLRGSQLIEWLNAPERRRYLIDQQFVIAHSSREASEIGHVLQQAA